MNADSHKALGDAVAIDITVGTSSNLPGNSEKAQQWTMNSHSSGIDARAANAQVPFGGLVTTSNHLADHGNLAAEADRHYGNRRLRTNMPTKSAMVVATGMDMSADSTVAAFTQKDSIGGGPFLPPPRPRNSSFSSTTASMNAITTQRPLPSQLFALPTSTPKIMTNPLVDGHHHLPIRSTSAYHHGHLQVPPIIPASTSTRPPPTYSYTFPTIPQHSNKPAFKPTRERQQSPLSKLSVRLVQTYVEINKVL